MEGGKSQRKPGLKIKTRIKENRADIKMHHAGDIIDIFSSGKLINQK
jgi:hypothetical protein